MPTTEVVLPTPLESTCIVVWEFQVKAECVPEFVGAYGPDGEWARLFRRSPEFLGVELLGDRLGPMAWVGGGLILAAAVTLTVRENDVSSEVLLE